LVYLTLSSRRDYEEEEEKEGKSDSRVRIGNERDFI